MASNDYHFITTWYIPGTVSEVIEILSDAAALVRWWPSVYLDVQVLSPGDARGLGKRISLYTKGWLPYTLRWQFQVSEISEHGFTLVAEGDFVGRGIWTFSQEGDSVKAVYDWKIEANKPLLRNFSFILKPIFAANHHWAMARGEESLKLELTRRRAPISEALAQIPAPPPATTIVPFVVAVTIALSVVVL